MEHFRLFVPWHSQETQFLRQTLEQHNNMVLIMRQNIIKQIIRKLYLMPKIRDLIYKNITF